MTEENQNTMAAPLDTDLATVDTGYSLLADGYYDVRINEAKLQPTSSGGEMIHLEMRTLHPSKGQKNEDLGANIPIFDNVNTKPTGKSTWDMVKRNAAGLVQAVGLTGCTLQNVPTWVPQLLGRTLQIKVGFEPDGVNPKNGKAYRAKNVVLLYIKRK